MKHVHVNKPLLFMLTTACIIILLILLMQPLSIIHFGPQIDMLFPRGLIALEERNLLFIIQGLMLLVIIPVYVLTFVFSWIYRADNPKGKYDPKIVDNVYAEYVWWGLPLVLTTFIAVLTCIETARLDPYKPIVHDKKPITIEVLALNWKWLFIYPEEKIASINLVQFPENTPIHFKISADAPMNSFWIPSLGGQIYAMTGMKTELFLIADRVGDYRGCSANISGKGFSGMVFTARASTEEEYQEWLKTAKQAKGLDWHEYKNIAKPSEYHPVELFALQEEGLFDKIIMNYMHP